MAKILFLPVSIGAGLLAGLTSKKLFRRLWGAIDNEDAPKPEDRKAGLGKLALALAVEGALLRVVKGLANHGARHGFARLTGSWPGDEEPKPD